MKWTVMEINVNICEEMPDETMVTTAKVDNIKMLQRCHKI